MLDNESTSEILPFPKTPEEKLVHVLSIMRNAAIIRRKYFEVQHYLNEEYLNTHESIDPKTGQPISKERIYEAIHVEYIFSAIRAIEALYGVEPVMNQ